MRRVSSLFRNEWVLLGLIILIAIFFRFYQLDSIPIGLHSDEAFKGYAATKYILQHKAVPVFFQENLGEEPMYVYLVALSLLFSKGGSLAIRVVSASVGTTTVPLVYLLAKELFPAGGNRTPLSPVGLMAALWLALSYWHVNYSRLGMEPILLPLFITIISFSFWRGVKSQRKLYYLLAGLFLGLSLYTYRAARLFPLVLLIYIVCYILLTGRLDRRLLVNWVILFAAAFLVFAPLGYFAITHSDIYFSRAGDVSIFNPELNHGSPLRALMSGIAKTMASFHLLPDPNWRQNPAGRSLLDPITGLFFLLGLGIVLSRWRRLNYLFILVWLLVMSLPAALTASGLPHSSRSIGLLPVACMLPAIGLHDAMEWLRRRRIPKGILRLSPLVAVILFVLVSLSTYIGYFTAWGSEELPHAFDMAFGEAAEAMNSLTRPGGVWILPLTSLADPGSVHYTVEFLYRGDAPHYFLRVDEGTVAEELTGITQGYDEAWVIEWDQSTLGGAYLYHADPKGVLSFLLTKYGQELDRKRFQTFDVVSYRLPATPDFAIARSFQLLRTNFEHQVALRRVAYGGSSQGATSTPLEVETGLLPSGKDAWVALQWEALALLSRDYKAAVYLVDGRGRLLGQMDKVMLSNDLNMTSEWQVGQMEIDYYTVSSPSATPPGEYYIEVAVYDAESMHRLPVLDEEGKISGQSFKAGTIQVVEPLVPPQVEPQVEMTEGDIAPGISLLGYDLPLREIEPGNTVLVALYWQALQDVDDDYILAVGLRGETGEIWAEQRDRPVDGTYPTTEWDEGEVLRDWHDVIVPADTPQGTYELFLSMMKREEFVVETSLGEVQVQGRPHYFAVPEISYPFEMMVGENIRLLGYDLENGEVEAGGVLRLTLHWQAVAEMGVSYTVFTHLLNGDYQIRAQKDSIPGGGSLPTTSWIQGEVVTDIYDLVVDADAAKGEYMLEIGMYDVVTGDRLPVYDARGEPLGDRLLLRAISVLP